MEQEKSPCNGLEALRDVLSKLIELDKFLRADDPSYRKVFNEMTEIIKDNNLTLGQTADYFILINNSMALASGRMSDIIVRLQEPKI